MSKITFSSGNDHKHKQRSDKRKINIPTFSESPFLGTLKRYMIIFNVAP